MENRPRISREQLGLVKVSPEVLAERLKQQEISTALETIISYADKKLEYVSRRAYIKTPNVISYITGERISADKTIRNIARILGFDRQHPITQGLEESAHAARKVRNQK